MKARAAWDLIVVGGGPAGSTLAGIVRRHDPKAKVLVLEKASFPRHHVGESLLPGAIPVLKELGVHAKIEAGGFPRKMGVVFVWGDDRKPWDADFNNLNLEMVKKYGRLLDTEFSWQVLRSRYDEILLDHAAELGADVRFGWRAVSALEEKGRVVGVVVEKDGVRETLRCGTLADCSGQSGFLGPQRGVRAYDEDLKNTAAYAYFKGAKWKFEFSGHPDKTKIFVCSVPEGWFWYIPLADDMVSVGLVSKAADVKRRNGGTDYRKYFFDALGRCEEIAPLLKDAKLMNDVDPHEPGKEFFTMGDWSYRNERACGEGWLAAGDAAFFLDPLLSSGVMMAHLSGHRAAYTWLTSRRETDEELGRLLWADYDRFCKEVSGSFLALVRFWYRHDPNARAWWSEARKALDGRAPTDLDDKTAFVAVAAGLTYYFERAYTSQSLLFGSSGAEHSWQWEGTKLELKNWTRQILAIVETGFLKAEPRRDEKLRRAEAEAAREEIPDSWIPRLARRIEEQTTFLPTSPDGRLHPARRYRVVKTQGLDEGDDAANPRRILPRSYALALSLVDGKRSAGLIKRELARLSPLPRDVLDAQAFRLLKDLAVLGAVEWTPGPDAPLPPEPTPRAKDAWGQFRDGEAALRRGDPSAAEAALSRALAAGAEWPWAYALRGEARRHLGRPAEAARDLDESLRRCAAPPAARGAARLDVLREGFEAGVERAMLEDRIRLLRGKLRLASGDAKGAREDADAALRINPRQSEALVVRAKAAMALGDLAAAKADLAAALAVE
ncbi:MAG TPA: tryptophan 7-halogenase, partial [Elusimicrobiota bacterium]|nr:tryptophan 7-halogenase [Elusimicrobiota bacterium]